MPVSRAFFAHCHSIADGSDAGILIVASNSHMDLQLNGKTALVTGSTAGIGHAIATALAGEDATVIVNGRTQARVDEAIKSIQAANTVNGSQKYTIQDTDPLYPVSYYRLKIVDVDNSFTYSETKMVKLNTEEGNFLVSPNPVYRNINIALKQNITSQNIHVELLNTLGVKIPVQPAFGGNNISMEIPGLANGIYFLNVYINGTKYSRKLLIVQ